MTSPRIGDPPLHPRRVFRSAHHCARRRQQDKAIPRDGGSHPGRSHRDSSLILLSTPRAVVRGPENPPGVEWRVPNSGTGHRDRKRRRESATNILINGLSCTTGITYSRNKTCGKLRHTRSDNSDARGRREHALLCASERSDWRLQKYESSKK